jgi:hypothetical protein
MKKDKTIYWTATILIFLFEGVMPALASQTDFAKEGIRHLGYPEYFGNVLVVFKIMGALILVIPHFRKRVKEWAYAGFTFDFIFAGISYGAVDGIDPHALLPIMLIAFLAVSYHYWHKISCTTNADYSSGSPSAWI